MRSEETGEGEVWTVASSQEGCEHFCPSHSSLKYSHESIIKSDSESPNAGWMETECDMGEGLLFHINIQWKMCVFYFKKCKINKNQGCQELKTRQEAFYSWQDGFEQIFSLLPQHIVGDAVCRGLSACWQTEQREPSAAVWLLSNNTPWLPPAYSTLPEYAPSTPLTVAMVIEAGISNDGRSTDIRAALKLKHQTSAGGGDLLSLCSKSIWTITSLWACNGSNTLNWLRKPSPSSLWRSYYIPPCMKGWMKGQTIIWIKDTGVGWK